MRELKHNEIEEISGGWIRSFAVGVLGSYAYDMAGGSEGINNYLSNSYQSARSSFNYWNRKIGRMFRP